MKIRIFALAKELGLDSKVLIDICNDAGIKLKNSALASITPEQRDMVVAFLESDAKPSEPAPEAPAPVVTVREEPINVKKLRTIRSMAPRPQHGEVGGDDSADEPSFQEAQGDTATATVESDDAERDRDEVDGVAADSEAMPDDDADDAAVAAVDDEDDDSGDTEEDASPEIEKRTAGRPMRGERNGGGRRQMREMKPIGSVKDREGGRASKSKPSSLPNIAAPPSYTPPSIKKKSKEVEKAQKPDMALSDIVDQQSPLADQLRLLKHARDKHEQSEKSGPARRGGGQKGSLLKQLRESREVQRQNKRVRRRRRSGPVELKSSAQIDLPITVRSLSEAIGRPARQIISILFKDGRMATINDELTEEESLEIALEMGVDLEIRRGRDIEAELLADLDEMDDEETLEARPPIITILGHVDHGKTTLLDKLRRSNVAAGEAGGITQHIASYQVEHNGRKLTFVDTPGHAAFGEMRARGANVTDIIVLVVAADDGVMPQTEECISHAKSAGVPIVVAMNKMDLPDIDEQKVLQQLASHEILPAEWSGDTEIVRTSAETGLGLDDLLETLLLTAELHEYRANANRPAVGVCLESFLDEGRGVVAWLIVQKGTLRVGDIILCGTSVGRIRAIYNDRDEEIDEAGPSTPVRVAGLDDVPSAGNHFFVMPDIDEAREVADNRVHEGRTESLSSRGKPMTIDDILEKARGGYGVQDMPLILKADTPGSLEALHSEISKFDHPEVRVSIIHEAVGGVNESDVYLASAAGAIIIAFHVIAEDRAAEAASREGVDIRRYNIIYEVTDHIRTALEGMLRPEEKQVTTGRAIVLRTFQISRFGTIAGCRVLNGTIARDNRIHVIRDQKVLNDYRIASLKREKDDVKEVRDGMECGIRLDGFNDIKDGDLLEAYRIDHVQRKLDG